jgi:hypothetical protein
MARYNVGDKLLTIQFKSERNENEGLCFGPWVSEPHIFNVTENVQFEIVELTVTEHHKVSWEYDTENKLDCDGFKLIDAKNIVWHNQFPKASYGQMTDSQDRIFNRRDELEEEKHNLLFSQYPICTRLVTDFLKFLKQGFNCDNTSIRTVRVNLFLQIEQKLLNDFNLVLKEEPVFPDEPKCKDITHFVLVKKD